MTKYFGIILSPFGRDNCVAKSDIVNKERKTRWTSPLELLVSLIFLKPDIMSTGHH